MAYINKEQVKQIRESLKKEFPEIKFSVRGENHSSVYVSILKSPYDFSDIPHYRKDYYTSINHFHVPDCKHRDIFEKILRIIKTGSEKTWFDNSDSMTDYFHVAFYINLYVGHHEKGYEMIPWEEVKKITKKNPKKKTKGISKSNINEITNSFISSI
tara:strand:+ start:300 stop:770 length:471 start_codon:yes stop_codon:yes gene_type:complete